MVGCLEGRIAIVTGGASGIGKACAAKLALEGATIILIDLQDAAGKAVVEAIRAQRRSAVFLRHDVSSEADWEAVASYVRDHHGRLDILVSNAGLGSSGEPITNITLDQWRRVQSVNVEGAFLGAKHCIPIMRESGAKGSIINMSSIAALRAGFGATGEYAASKAAVQILTQTIARECAADGIRCNAIVPGFIDTPIFEPLQHVNPPLQAVAHTIPLLRIGTTEDVAEAALYLASDRSSYITGHALIVDGGRSMV